MDEEQRVRKLVSQLNSPDPWEQAKAAEELAGRGLASGGAKFVLGRALESRNQMVRAVAAEELLKTVQLNHSSMRYLLEKSVSAAVGVLKAREDRARIVAASALLHAIGLLGSGKKSEQEKAAQAIGHGVSDVAKAILKMQEDRSPEVRKKAAEAIRFIGSLKASPPADREAKNVAMVLARELRKNSGALAAAKDPDALPDSAAKRIFRMAASFLRERTARNSSRAKNKQTQRHAKP